MQKSSYRRLFVLLAVLSVMLGAIPSAPAAASAGQDRGVMNLITSDAGGVSIEVLAPSLQLQAAAFQGQAEASGFGRPCQVIAAAGHVQSAEAGKPQLPVKVALLGVPTEARLTLHVQPLEARVVASGVSLCPAVTYRIEQEANGIVSKTTEEWVADPSVYGEDRLYPEQNVSLVDVGFMRSQRIARLEVYPLQYNPVSGELLLTERMRISVGFGDSVIGTTVLSAGAFNAEPAGFEGSLRDLLVNYEQAKYWRAKDVAPEAAAWTPPNPAVKVSVREDGIYQLTYAQLATAGLPVTTLDPKTLQLYSMGQEAAILVVGEADGQFDSEDVVLFYGQEANTRYTDTNVYWLTYGGAQGQRMSGKASQGGGTQAASFMASSRFEENFSYVSSLPKESGFDHWYGKLLTATGVSKSFEETLTLSEVAVAPSAFGELEVQLGGNIDRPHHIRLYVNGLQVHDDAANWTGRTVYSTTVSFPQSHLLEGANKVRVELVNDASGFVVDQSYTDWLRLGYQRSYASEGDVLAFGGDQAGAWQYRITDFTSASIEAYDVTDPAAPSIITGGSITGSAPYTFGFGDQSAGERRYVALTTAQRQAPVDIAFDTPSDLHDGPGADFVIITHPDFRSAIQPLADYRAAQGLRVQVVDVQDVYDEFGHGMMSAEAIRDFIAYAYQSANWTRPAPGYVLLVGDGTYDLRRYRADSAPTYVPPYLELVDADLGETASDNRFVAVSGTDNVPDLNIGRLPVNTAAEATTMVDKILAYETVSPEESWTSRMLLVSDDLEDGGGNFYALSDAIASGISLYNGQQVKTLPNPYTSSKIYLGQTCDTEGNPSVSVECRQQIVSGIDTGAVMVSYIGHGTRTRWAKENLYDAVALSQLANGRRLPIMLPMTCNEGYFHDAAAGAESLSEAGVRKAQNGVIASWAPTGFGLSSGHDLLERGLLLAMFYDRTRELGAAATAGKLYLVAHAAPNQYRDLIDTFLLLGDPALRVPLQDIHITYPVFLPLIIKN